MGYWVYMDVDIVIPEDKVDGCLAAINEMFTDENLLKNASGGCFGGEHTGPVTEYRWYSWVESPPNVSWAEHFKATHIDKVDVPPKRGFKTLIEAFKAWRYEAEGTPEGGVRVVSFIGEKLGDDELMLKTIAPFVAKHSIIYVKGEDGCVWTYVFEDGYMTETALDAGDVLELGIFPDFEQ